MTTTHDGWTPATLRAIADLVEQRDLPMPSTINYDEVAWNILSGGGDDTASRVADLARRIGGTWEKNDPAANDYNSKYYELSQAFHGLTLTITAHREQVCERVKVGEREVTREVPTATTTVTETEPVYEWRCVPLLAKAEATS